MALSQAQIDEIMNKYKIPTQNNASGDVSITPTARIAELRNKRAEFKAQQEASKPKPNYLQQMGQDILQTGKNLIGTAKETVGKIGDISKAQLSGQQGVGESFLQSTGAVAGGLSKGIGDVVTGGIKALVPEEGEQAVKAGIQKVAPAIMELDKVAGLPITNLLSKYESLDDNQKRDIDALLGIGSLATDLAGFGIGKKVAGKAGKEVLEAGISGMAKGAEAVGGVTTKLGTSAEKLKGKLVGMPFTEDKLLQDSIEITKPVFNKKTSISAFEKAGQPGGTTRQGLLGKFTTEPSKRDLDIAESVKNVVSKNNGPIDNIININNEISDISQNTIKPFLQSNPSPFNLKTLSSKLKTVEPSEFIKADPILQKTYDLVKAKMLKVVSKNKKTMEGLWDSRKEFDAIAERQIGNLDPMSGQSNAIKQAVLDVRRSVNEFIAENTPNGDEMFKKELKRLSDMYSARSNIAEQNYKLLEKNAIQRWMKQNPQKARLLKGGATATGGGFLFSLFGG